MANADGDIAVTESKRLRLKLLEYASSPDETRDP
jgi:hypothetical protein